MFMQDHRSDYTPLKSLTGVFSDDSSDDNDSDLISPKTVSKILLCILIILCFQI